MSKMNATRMKTLPRNVDSAHGLRSVSDVQPVHVYFDTEQSSCSLQTIYRNLLPFT